MSASTFCSDSSVLFCGGVGNILSVARTLPFSSITASLQPVRYAGSSPKIILPLSGGCNKRGFKLTSNIFIACSLAFSVRSLLTSLATDGKISRSYASAAADLTISADRLSFLTKTDCTVAMNASVSTLTSTFKHSSFSPRFTARILCEGIFDIFSL